MGHPIRPDPSGGLIRLVVSCVYKSENHTTMVTVAVDLH